MTFAAVRVSRLIVLASLVAAGGAHAFFLGQVSAAAPWVAAVAFAMSFALARGSLPLALMPALLTAYIAPATVLVAFNVHDAHVFVWPALLAGPISPRATGHDGTRLRDGRRWWRAGRWSSR